MVTGHAYFRKRIEHIPTGVIVEVSAMSPSYVATVCRRADALLRSQVWAVMNGSGPSDAVVASYDLPDDDMYPHELGIYRNGVELHGLSDDSLA